MKLIQFGTQFLVNGQISKYGALPGAAAVSHKSCSTNNTLQSLLQTGSELALLIVERIDDYLIIKIIQSSSQLSISLKATHP